MSNGAGAMRIMNRYIPGCIEGLFINCNNIAVIVGIYNIKSAYITVSLINILVAFDSCPLEVCNSTSSGQHSSATFPKNLQNHMRNVVIKYGFINI